MKKSNLTSIIPLFMLIAGLSLLLYPSFSDYWNSSRQSRAVASYVEQVGSLEDEEYELIWKNAVEYNKKLLDRSNIYVLPEGMVEEYNQQLNISGKGIMGYVDISSINVNLPIYHGISESILQVAVGHLDWTSLPTGGASTHCVVSGHRGLPSARLFTDLDKLCVGDSIIFHVLDHVLVYEVDQIKIVEPYEIEDLRIEEGQDLCTLVTCTPYGVNSHRLLVRGHRVENEIEEEIVRITNDAMQVEPLLVAPVVAAPILLVLLIILLIPNKKENK